MAQQGKQMKFGAREGFAYHSEKMALLTNGSRYYVDPNLTIFKVVKPTIHLKHYHALTQALFDTHSYL
jgi:hypothetical protein